MRGPFSLWHRFMFASVGAEAGMLLREFVNPWSATQDMRTLLADTWNLLEPVRLAVSVPHEPDGGNAVTNEQRKGLERRLWNIADELRGKMNADEFRDYMLGFIFYKYLSERIETFADDLLSEDEIAFVDLDEEDTSDREYLEAIKEEAVKSLGYFLPPSELFSTLAERGGSKDDDQEDEGDEDEAPAAFILDDLKRVLKDIQTSTMGEESEEDFVGLFEDIDVDSSKLGRTPEARNKLVVKILRHLDKVDFRISESSSDVLGDAYEYLIGQFASGAGKKAGEFYTPQAVSTVLARLVVNGRKRIRSVYDPTCGSGSLLLRVKRHVDEVANFYGQEQNRTTYNLARMNMILHGVPYWQFDIRQEDTLEHPQHRGERFEAIVANPPFSAKWSASKIHEGDERFARFGRLAPASKADMAFVAHMLSHLDEESGRMAVVLPHGVLFRGGAEGEIRRAIIETENVLDAVIGMPANIFYGTSIPTCVLLFKACREDPDNILFVDASSRFQKAKNQNHLGPDDVDAIVETVFAREPVERMARVVPIAEIRDNDFNLNIPRYVDTFEPEPEVDMAAARQRIEDARRDGAKADEAIRLFCAELKLESPV